MPTLLGCVDRIVGHLDQLLGLGKALPIERGDPDTRGDVLQFTRIGVDDHLLDQLPQGLSQSSGFDPVHLRESRLRIPRPHNGIRDYPYDNAP